ncbi:MAG: sigma-70 family RNA polymerase sigma factor [Solirubrobacterales bacterium]
MNEVVAPAQTGALSPGFARFAGDERLAHRAADGDERAFAAIFRRYHQDLYRYCLAILGNRDDAQDALQNTMVKALRALPGESRAIELKPWLYRIAHNESIDLVRRRRAGEPLDPELIAGGPGLAREAEARERLGNLLADLETLPASQRGALVMRELSGLDFEEIAEALGTSAATARQTLYEARLSLRQIEAGREMSCDTVTGALSDGDGRVLRRRDLRAHLRSCADCRSFRAEIDGRSRDLAALSPLPALAAAGILQGLFGGGGGGGAAGGGLAGLLGGGAAKAIGTSAAVKATATVAAVAVLGAGVAQRANFVDLGLPVGGGNGSGSTADPSASGSTPVPEQRGAAASGIRAETKDVAVRPAAARGARPTAQGPEAQPNGRAGREAAAAEPSQLVGERNHEPSLPAAASKGQQTAATHRNAAPGKSTNAGHNANSDHPVKAAAAAPPARAPKPSKAATPAKPAKGNEPAPHPAAAGSESSAAGKGKEKVAPETEESP